MTLPLLLHTLSLKASSTEVEGAVARRQLAIYSKAMNLQQCLYDGTDFCYEIIENIQRYADQEQLGLFLDTENGDGSGSKKVTSKPTTPAVPAKASRQSLAWRGLLVRKPRVYLRLVLHVDVALCEGAPPKEHDFPAELRRS